MVVQPRCPECGRFCGQVYRYRGPCYMPVVSCVYCGINPPYCSKETRTVKGCQQNAKYVEQVMPNMKRYWCEEHRTEESELLPYVEGGE